MRPSKKLQAGFFPTLLALVAMLVVACGGGGTTTGTTPTSGTHTKAPQDQQVLISGAEIGTADILSFDPALAPDALSAYAIYNVFTGLVSFDDKLNLKCQLCTTYSVGPDGVTYTFKIVAEQPAAFFLETLSFQASFVVEKSVVTKWGKAWTDHLADNGGQGGDGPFKVLEYTHNKQIVFVPNDKYYGSHPQLAKVVFPFYKQADTAYQVYQVNGIDSTSIPTKHLDTDRRRSDFINGPFLAINYYTMNYLQKPFDVTSCRQAFALAINKDVIVKNVWKNSFLATNHIVPMGQYGYNPNLKGPDGTTSTAGNQTAAQNDLKACEQAQGYASAANFPPITLTYSSAGAQDVRNEVAAMQQMWQNVLGISVKTDDIDLNKLFSDEGLGSNNPLQFYTGPAWLADYPDPQDWTTLQFDKGASQNGMSFGQNHGPDAAAQQMVQQQMEAADKMTGDPKAREMAYWNIEQQLVNYVAWFPMEQQEINILQKPCVQGVVQNAFGLTPPDDWGNIFISTDTPCAKLT